MTGSYNNFFRIFDCNSKKDITLEASKDNIKPRGLLKPKKVRIRLPLTCVTVTIASGFPGNEKEERRSLGRLPELQQESPSFSVASAGKYYW